MCIRDRPTLLSKYMAFGMSMQEVFDAAILAPAKQLGLEEELATLKPETAADVAVFRLMERDMKFYDLNGEYITGNQALVPQLTIKDGTCLLYTSRCV